MGVFGTSGVTVWIGQSNQDGPLTPLMTRTISKYVTHDRFFPFLYVSLIYRKGNFSFYIWFALICFLLD